jgi:hypothetical protein
MQPLGCPHVIVPPRLSVTHSIFRTRSETRLHLMVIVRAFKNEARMLIARSRQSHARSVSAPARQPVIGAPEMKGDYVTHGGAFLVKDNERVDGRGGPFRSSTVGRESSGSEHGDLECSTEKRRRAWGVKTQMSNNGVAPRVTGARSSATKPDRDRAVDDLDNALDLEFKAHVAVVAIGEEWKALVEDRIDPTEEEHSLHAHLIRKWQRAAGVVAQILQRPLR